MWTALRFPLAAGLGLHDRWPIKKYREFVPPCVEALLGLMIVHTWSASAQSTAEIDPSLRSDRSAKAFAADWRKYYRFRGFYCCPHVKFNQVSRFAEKTRKDLSGP
jgi:hypothetical protein